MGELVSHFCFIYKIIFLIEHKGHCSEIKQWVEKYLPNWKPEEKKRSPTVSSSLPLSKRRIDLKISDEVRDKLTTENSSNSPKEYYPEANILPTLCTCGGKWKKDDERFCDGVYYALTFKQSAVVYYRRCIAEKCEFHYDGQADGVFNYSGETLVSYALLYDYTKSCIEGATTWSAFVSRIQYMYNEVYCNSALKMDFMSIPTFVQVYTTLHIILFHISISTDCASLCAQN